MKAFQYRCSFGWVITSLNITCGHGVMLNRLSHLLCRPVPPSLEGMPHLAWNALGAVFVDADRGEPLEDLPQMMRLRLSGSRWVRLQAYLMY